MKNFNKKVEYMNKLFMYKFKVMSSDIHELKMYGISPDSNHTYIIIKRFLSENRNFAVIGNFSISKYDMSVNESEPINYFELTDNEYNQIKKMINGLSTWYPTIINNIIGLSMNKNSEDLLF